MTIHKVNYNEHIPDIVAKEMALILSYLVKQNGGEMFFNSSVEPLRKITEKYTLVKETKRDDSGKVINFTLRLVKKN